jgi:PKD repeat protein
MNAINKIKIFVFVLLFVSNTGLLAQQWYYFQGQITDVETQYPVVEYPVFIDLGDVQPLVTFTDVNGYYLDSLFVNTDTLSLAVASVFDCFDEIHFKVFDPFVDSNYADFSICIIPNNCFAYFAYQIDNQNNMLVDFVDLSSGEINKWNWDFGDGNTSNLSNPSHEYAEYGIYQIVLIVEDSLGNCWSSYDEFVNLGDTVFCQANFEYVNNSSVPNTIDFTDLSIGNFQLWQWDFGDGYFSFDQNPTHTYSQSGIYEACLLVTDTIQFCSDYYCMQILVGDTVSCVADFEVVLDTLSNTPNTYVFSDQSTGNITSWNWNFGDGNFSNIQNPNHVYEQEGDYVVCLNVSSDGSGNICSDEKCKTVSTLEYFSFGGHAFIDGFPINIEENDSSNIATATLFRKYENQWQYMDQRVFWKFGYYYFVNKPEGEYLLRIDLNEGSIDYNKYSPSYYINSSNWITANTFNLISDEQLATDINFQELAIQESGVGTISGLIKPGETCGSEITLANQVVKLFNGENKYVAFDRTNEEGEFEFSALGADNYRLQAEITGKTSSTEFVEINASIPFSDNHILSIDCDSYVGIINNEYSEDIEFGKIYPIPANDFVNMEVLSQRNMLVEIDIVDLSGRVVDSKIISVREGESSLNIDLKNLHSGMYIYTIKTEKNLKLKSGKLMVN